MELKYKAGSVAMNIMEKYQFICDTVIKYNTGMNPSYEDINTAFSYFHELTANNQYPADGPNPRIIGSTLSVALSNSYRK